MGEGANGSSWSVKLGRVEGASGIMAIASRSVPEGGRGAVGTTGARLLSEGLAQQAPVGHLLHPEPQQELTGPVAGVEPPAISVERSPCHTRTNPSKSAMEIFPTRAVITLYWSSLPFKPYQSGKLNLDGGPLLFPEKVLLRAELSRKPAGVSHELLSSPQPSICLPMSQPGFTSRPCSLSAASAPSYRGEVFRSGPTQGNACPGRGAWRG